MSEDYEQWRKWVDIDHHHLWHPFTQMSQWCQSPPLIIERAQGNYLIGVDGKHYLDGISSLWVNLHGHRRREIDDAVRDQLERVAHSTLLGLSNVPAIQLAEALIDIAPAGLERVFYSDSGSTAVEVALKMAFQYWQHSGRPEKSKFVALDNAYHGDTLGSVSVGGIDLFHQLFSPLLFHSLRIPSPHPYRFVPSLDFASSAADDLPAACSAECLCAAETLFRERGDEIAALIIEPLVQGAAGIIVQPQGYLNALAKLCRTYDILLICDEVATGFGRTGTLFACDAEFVAPDLMCVAKGLSGGYLPLAATLTTDAIYQAFHGPKAQTFFHGHSYTGNPLAAAAALASLRIFKDDNVIEKIAQRVAHLKQRLARDIAPLNCVGDIRQCGLMVGIEVVADRQTKRSFAEDEDVGARICADARNRGLLLRPLGSTIVLMPPLSITDRELDHLVGGLAESTASVVDSI